jgi:superfamily II DNA/RNA helicase
MNSNKIIENDNDDFGDSWAVSSTTIQSSEKVENIIEQPYIANDISVNGKEMITDFKNRGIEMQGIEPDTIIKEWTDLFLLKNPNPNKIYMRQVIESIIEHGFDSPRPIQSITVGNMCKDLIAQAVAGNGKTGAFVIGAVAQINPLLHKTQCVILSPTQLLTDQTTEVVRKLTAKTGITVHCYRGGLPFPRDKKYPHIIVACPGRLNDMINHGKVNLSSLNTLVLDEGDELLRQGFREQIKNIIESIIDSVHICLFSATFPKGILEICSRFMRDPAYVILPDNQVMTKLVSQWYISCDELSQKDGAVVDAIQQNISSTIIIFFNSCTRLQKVSEILYGQNIIHACVHGKIPPAERLKPIADFASKKCNILLASDVAARGLDIPHVTLVINYDIPGSVETYIHRIGRSGRGENMGNSITLIMSEEDMSKLKYIMNMNDIVIKPLKSIKMTK